MPELIEPMLRCTACGAPAIRSEERLLDVTVDGRALGWWMLTRIYYHAEMGLEPDGSIGRSAHAISLGAYFPAPAARRYSIGFPFPIVPIEAA